MLGHSREYAQSVSSNDCNTKGTWLEALTPQAVTESYLGAVADSTSSEAPPHAPTTRHVIACSPYPTPSMSPLALPLAVPILPNSNRG